MSTHFRRLAIWVGFIFLLSFYNIYHTHAADNTPDDPVFGPSGHHIIDVFPGALDRVMDVLELPDGRYYLLVGNATTNQALAILRYNADGTLDTSFNGTGSRVITFGELPVLGQLKHNFSSTATGRGRLAVDSQDRLIIGLESTANGFYGVSVGRLTSTGLTDPFSSVANGEYNDPTSRFNFYDQAGIVHSLPTLEGGGFGGIAVDDLDNIIVAGHVNKFEDLGQYDFMFFRILSESGDRDTTYNFGIGYLVIDVGDFDQLYDFMRDAEGRFVAVGRAGAVNTDLLAIVRLTADGLPDNTFGAGGGGTPADLGALASPALGVRTGSVYFSENSQYLVTIIEEGARYIVGGSVRENLLDTDGAILAVNKSNGQLDTTFGTNGFLILDADPAGVDRVVDLARNKVDDKFIAAAQINSNNNLGFYRFHLNGTTDSIFTHTTPNNDLTVSLLPTQYGQTLLIGLRELENVLMVRLGKPEITITPASPHDFGVVDSLGLPVSQTFTIENITSVDMYLRNITATGTGYSVSSTTCPTNGYLGGNTQVGGGTPTDSTCTFTVTFDPSSFTVGAVATGSVTVNSGATDAPSHLQSLTFPDTVNLTATVVVPPEATIGYSQSVVALSTESTPSQTVLTIEIDNPNVLPVTNLSLSKLIPSNLTYVAGSIGTTGDCSVTPTITGNTLNVPSQLIVANGTCTITATFSGTTAGVQADPIINNLTGTFSTIVYSNRTSNNAGDITVVSLPTIAKSFSTSALLVNNDLQATVTITNTDNNAISGISFTDALPAGVTFVAVDSNTCTGTLSNTATSFSLSGATLNALASCEIVVDILPTTDGLKTNQITDLTATLSGRVFGPVNSDTALTIAEMQQTAVSFNAYPPPQLTKQFSPDTIYTDASSTLTFTLTNPNAVDITNIEFNDDISALAITFDSSAITGTCLATYGGVSTGSTSDELVISQIDLLANTSCTVIVPITETDTSGNYTNTVTEIRTALGDTTLSATDTLTIITPSTVTKAFAPNPVIMGVPSVLTFTVTNPDLTSPVTNIGFTDALTSANLAYTGATSGTCAGVGYSAGYVGQTLTATGIDLAPNTSCTVTVSVNSTVAGTYPNTITGIASAAGSVPDSTPIDLVVLNQLSLTKSFNQNPVIVGNPSTLTFTLTNPNDLAIPNISFSDNISGFAPNIAFDTSSVGGTCQSAPYNATITPTADLLTVSDLTMGSTTSGNNSCTITVLMNSTVAGTYLNTTSTVQSGSNTIAPAASDTLTVLQDATISKTFTPAAIYTGETSQISIVISNPNSTALTGVTLQDDLSTFNITLDTSTASNTCGGTSTSTFQSLGFTSFSIPASSTCTITATVAGNASGISNNITSAITSDQGAGTATGTATLTVVASLGVTKAFAPNPVMMGVPTVLTFTVTNPDPTSSVTNISFTDTLTSPNIGYMGATSGTCAGAGYSAVYAGQTLTVTGVDLAPNTTCTVTVSVDSTVAGTYPNTITGISSAVGSLPDSVPVHLVVLDPLMLTKSFSQNPVIVGNPSMLTFTLTNINDMAIPNITFSDDISGFAPNIAFDISSIGGTCQSAPYSATITPTAGLLTVSNLTIGSTSSGNNICTITVLVNSTVAGAYLNTTSAVQIGPAIIAPAASDTLTVLPDLTINKAFTPATIYTGETSTLTITLDNTGGSSGLTGIAIQDDLSSLNLTLDPSTIGGTCVGDTSTSTATLLSASGIDLAAGSSCTLTATVMGVTAGNHLNVTTPITSDQGAGTATGTATLNVVAPLGVTKAFAPNPVVAGNSTVLTFTVSNPDPTSSVANISFTDTLTSTDITYTGPTSGTCAGVGYSAGYAGQTLTATGVDLAPNTTCTVIVSVTSSIAGTYPNTITGITTAIGNLPDSTPVDLIVVDLPTLDKVFMPDLISVNGTSELTFTITNPVTGFSHLTALTFTETLPAGLVIADPPNAANTCNGAVSATAGDNTIILSNGDLLVDSACTVTVAVTSATVGTYTNNPTDVTGFDSDQALNMPVTFTPATLDVVLLPTLAKTFTPDQIAMNDLSTLTFTITNPAGGTDPVTGLTFVETLPSDVVIAPTPNESTTCLNGSVNVLGADSFELVGGDLAAGATCTVMIDVTGAIAGIYTNEEANVTNFRINEIVDPLPIAFAPATLEIIGMPVVIDTASNAGALTDGDVINVDVTSLSITYNDDLSNVDDATNYALLAVGDALESAVDVCPITPTGDDTFITIDNATYDLASLTVTLEVNGGTRLSEGVYVLVICADNLQDHIGQSLDGNRDGVAGGNYQLTFTVDFAITPTPPPTSEPTPNIDVFDPAISKIGLLLPGQLGLAGERLEWITTISNHGNASGYNVVVTDTLRPELRIESVSAPGGTVVINNQTVTVTYSEIQAGQVVNFSIFTTVLRSDVTIDNIVCLEATGIQSICTTGYPAGELPDTGETPFWREYLRQILGD